MVDNHRDGHSFDSALKVFEVLQRLASMRREDPVHSEDRAAEPPRITEPDSQDDSPTQLRPAGDAPQSNWLPSIPPALQLDVPRAEDLTQLEPGQRLGDFLIRRVLGRGGFAAVYLALQWSLDREVALKVTAPQAWQDDAEDSRCRGEGQHLAQLEHPNIVHVYQQTIEPHTGAHLLCMQYVPGATLDLLIARLSDRAGRWSGRDFLDAIDRLPQSRAVLETSAPERQTLERADHIETICRLGSQLASALEHAHRRGIFHRDIKPANVLVNPYGRPLLADFNLATHADGAEKTALIGGTLAYMSPEDLEAFSSQQRPTATRAGQLGDIYSLGMLLWQTSTGRLPFADATDLKAELDAATRLQRMAQRRQTPEDQWCGSEVLTQFAAAAQRREPLGPEEHRTDPRSGDDASYCMLAQTLRKCLRAEPSGRFRSAGELKRVFDGLANLHAARKALPPPGQLSFTAKRFPIIALLLAGLIPQLSASALQIAYNLSRVLANFQPAQSAVFFQLVWWANPIIYGTGLFVFVHYLLQILPTWQRLQRRDPTLSDRETTRARRHALRLPARAAIIAGCGWLVGAVVFPGGVILLAGPLPWSVLLHFVMSFLLAGLVSVTYSAFAIMVVVLRFFYPYFWLNPKRLRRRASAELGPLDQRLDRVTFLAGTIPLLAAVTLIAGPQSADDQRAIGFRVLTVLLILAGGVGFSLVGRVIAGLRNWIGFWVRVPGGV